MLTGQTMDRVHNVPWERRPDDRFNFLPLLHAGMEKSDIMQDNHYEIETVLEKQKEFFAKGMTKNIRFRKKALIHLKRAILLYREELERALFLDLGKHRSEAYMTEIGFVLAEISDTIQKLGRWAADKKALTPIYLRPGQSRVRKEPYGSVLIIGPYSCPFQLLMGPLVSALAAGNCAVVRTSGETPYTSEVILRMILHAFRPEYVCCAPGDKVSDQVLLQQDFDYIFFSGSPGDGRFVMQAAAEKLIPVTLELGGKNPVIVDRTADLKSAAVRIMWGKLLNAGQTSAAPDYILADETVLDELLRELEAAKETLYGTEIRENPDYGRIVSGEHFDRLEHILEKDAEYIVSGGERDRDERFISPAVLDLGGIKENNIRKAACMQEELFGPLLPVIGYRKLQQALDYINNNSRPLALYLFTGNQNVKEVVLEHTSSGGVSVNDTINHTVNTELPLGGIGNSGMGQYHGKYGFDTFTHLRSVYERHPRLAVTVGYPPYSKAKLKVVRKFLK